jgi:TATA-binding protein-associated factor
LSSDTQKYDIKEAEPVIQGKSDNLNDILSEKIKQQRKLLNSKLGIDVGGAAKLDTTHIFSDYDLIASTTAETISNQSSIPTIAESSLNLKRKVTTDLNEPNNGINLLKAEPIEEDQIYNNGSSSKLSYEESLKKKFKKSTSSIGQQSADEANTSDEEIKANYVKSLELFAQWLLNKLFDPDWEVRHGAATSLREIIKRLTYSLIKHFESADNKNLTINLNWFQDCLVKLLSVITLDRFADYVGDEAVAPVRETCAQSIGIISSLFYYNDNSVYLNKLCSIINMFLNESSENCWEVRHSGIMILKYTVAATAAAATKNPKSIMDNLDVEDLSSDLSKLSSSNLNNLKIIFSLTFENILSCIRDKDDDVRQVASASLEPVSKLIHNLLDENRVELLIRILIDVLSEIDDLGTSCANIMCLLSDLLSSSSSTQTNPDDVNLKLIFLRLLNGQSVIPRLLPFLQHININVRQTTLNTINKIIIAINETNNSSKNGHSFEAMESQENLTILFRLLYQQAILLSSESSFKLIESLLIELWTTLCNKLSPHYLINICFPYITTWLLLFMHPSNQPIDSIYLISNLQLNATTTTQSAVNNSNLNASLNSPNATNRTVFKLTATPSINEVKEYIGSNQVKFEDKLTRDLTQTKCRLLAAKLLAILFNRISMINEVDANSKEKPIDLIINFLSSNINFKSGLQRFCFAILMIEWGSLISSTQASIQQDQMDNHNSSVNNLIQTKLGGKIVSCLDDENTIYFDEIALLFTRLQKECRCLINNYSNFLAKFNISLSDYLAMNVFTFEDINSLTNLVQQKFINNLNEKEQLATSNLKNLFADLKLSTSNLIELNQQTSQEQESLAMRSSFTLASASIQVNYLCERMNPLIRPLVDCIRFEPNQDLQLVSSKHLAMLLSTCSKRTPNPVPKIFKNLLNYLCNDQTKTPVIQNMPNMTILPDKDYYDVNRYYGILSDLLAQQQPQQTFSAQMSIDESSCATPKAKKRIGSVSANDEKAVAEQLLVQQQQQQLIKQQIEKRGAELTFKSICQLYDDKLEQIIPEIIQQPLNQINLIISLINKDAQTTNICNDLALIDELNLDVNASKYQELANYLTLIEHICSTGCLNKSLLEKILNEIPNMIKLIKSPLTCIRNLIARCLASICKQELIKTMSLLLEFTIDCLENNEFNLFSRQGAIELVYCIFEKLNDLIIPFTVIFIVPVLKRMCDLDWFVRSIASQCFATLVKLYPLGAAAAASSKKSIENGQVDLVFDSLNQIAASNQNIMRMKVEQQDFLDQLMDNRKLKPYQLPHEVLINVKLRPYQQMGVNWLAFLKKFNLHGILCDDMGLGKTLQSICILAGDHYEKIVHRKQHENDNHELLEANDDDAFLPTIIICPTTLTNHWFHEIERFVDTKCLRPFIYSGSVSERESLRAKFFNTKTIKSRAPNKQAEVKNEHRYNVFIVSYDIIRHDIAHICSQRWNYCILDEGHLIKSSKTKLSKSIKQIRASHRLILTGTPIQNNVTELWCLFDFLIPGYLGTEKQFHLKYSRFIVPQSASFQRTLERAMSQQAGNKANDNSGENNNSNNKGFHHLSLIALETLHKQVLPFLLRRTKEEVLNDLPPKIIQDYYCEMSQLQIDLYQDFAKSEVSDNIKKSLGLADEEDDVFSNDNKDLDLDYDVDEKKPKTKPIKSSDSDSGKNQSSNGGEHVFQALQYLRKVVNHPSLVLKPDHPKWAQIQAQLHSTGTSINDIKHSGKLVALRELLMECGIGLASNNDDNESTISDMDNNSVLNQHRVLIFCQLKSMIDIIENEVLKKMVNVSFLRLDGTIPPAERFGVVKRFNSDPSIDILLLTTQIGGLGLNLTGADTVIFCEHDWNPQKDLQAMDRAHRIGQTRVVNVYRLITKRTIEEKIMSLQKFKLGIADSVVNIENSSLSSMGTEQIMNMFNKEEPAQNKKDSTSSAQAHGGQYQRVLENINELWDENQYENEYSLDNFIKSLHK